MLILLRSKNHLNSCFETSDCIVKQAMLVPKRCIVSFGNCNLDVAFMPRSRILFCFSSSNGDHHGLCISACFKALSGQLIIGPSCYRCLSLDVCLYCCDVNLVRRHSTLVPLCARHTWYLPQVFGFIFCFDKVLIKELLRIFQNVFALCYAILFASLISLFCG